jgi:hypothetical protein
MTAYPRQGHASRYAREWPLPPLLTMGYDADDEGSFVWFSGLQLQVIDVAMLDAPTLLHREIIGTRGSTSDAATNHLAFNYFPELKLLAIAMTICEGGRGGELRHGADVQRTAGVSSHGRRRLRAARRHPAPDRH